jgi:hypothetical protein
VGSSGMTRRSGPRAYDLGTLERMALKDLFVLCPSQAPTPRPSSQPLFPRTLDAPLELPETTVIRWTSIVPVVAAKFRVESGLLLVHGVVSMGSAPFSDVFQGSP